MNNKQTGIICTLGPASSNPEVFAGMAREGMSAARLNFSHGSRVSHSDAFDLIAAFNRSEKSSIPVLQDLEGYRIRVAEAGGGDELEIEKGKKYFWGREKSEKKNYIRFDYDGPLEDIAPGSSLYADDGMIYFKVLFSSRKYIEAEAVIPGVLEKNKGVNLPEAVLSFSGVKDKDRDDVLFGLAKGVNYVAQSFVRNAGDILALRGITGGRKDPPGIIAKIECREGIANIDEIIEASDGIMIARGDMGVSVPVYTVPVIQKRIIRKCRDAGRFVITATQMLESMTHFPRPTRAEVSDVANAVIDGSDYTMLSGETAVGKYPVETVRTMRRTIEYTLDNMDGANARQSKNRSC